MNFGDFTDGGNPGASDYIAGYRTGGGVGSDRRWLRSTFANPPSNDGLALGSTSLQWSDAYFASGAILKWNNAATLTHSSTALSFTSTSLSLDVTDAANNVSVTAFAWPSSLSVPAAVFLTQTTTSASTSNPTTLTVQNIVEATASVNGAPAAISAGVLNMRGGLDSVGILGYINNDFTVASPTGVGLWALIRGNLAATGAVDGIRATSESFTSGGTTVTIDIANPAVINWPSHGFSAGQEVTFTSTGSLPTGITSEKMYFVLAAGLTAGTFRIAPLPAGTAVITTGSQNGVHTGFVPVHPRYGLHVDNNAANSFIAGIGIDGAKDYGIVIGLNANNSVPTHPYSFFGYSTAASYPTTTELWYVDSSGNQHSTTVTTTNVGSNFASGIGGYSAYFGSNADGQYPTTSSGLAIGTNFSSGALDVDFVNSNTSATTSFNFYQQTGASAQTNIASLSPASVLTLPQSLAAATSGDGLVLSNTQDAAVGSQRFSPRIRLRGSGWKTNATSAAQPVDWIIENKPVQGAAGPETDFVISSQINGGGYSQKFKIANDSTNGVQLNTTFGGSASETTIQVLLAPGGNIVGDFYADASQVFIGALTAVPFSLLTNGAIKATLSGSVFSPGASDGTALGSGSLMWSDLFLADGGVINFNNGNSTITHSAGLLTIAGAGLKLLAGTNTIAPLQFQAGTNLTSAVDGAMEFDGQALFFSPDASDRRIIPTVAICRLHAANTLADSTTLQKIFNASTNGTVTLPAGSYIFECVVGIDAMSATSGNAALSIVGAGGATVTNLIQVVVGIDGAKATAGAASGASWSVTTDVPAANTSVMTATVSTELAIMWKGSFETTAGTVIPSVDLITGGVTPAVKIGSYFMCWRMGAATDVTQGNWS